MLTSPQSAVKSKGCPVAGSNNGGVWTARRMEWLLFSVGVDVGVGVGVAVLLVLEDVPADPPVPVATFAAPAAAPPPPDDDASPSTLVSAISSILRTELFGTLESRADPPLRQ